MRNILTNRTYQMVAGAAFVFGAILFFTMGGEEANTENTEVEVTTESATSKTSEEVNKEVAEQENTEK